MYLRDLLAYQSRIEETIKAQRPIAALQAIEAMKPKIDLIEWEAARPNFTLSMFQPKIDTSIWTTLLDYPAVTLSPQFAEAISAIANPIVRDSIRFQASGTLGSLEAINNLSKSMMGTSQFVHQLEALATSYTSFLTGLTKLGTGQNFTLALSRFATSVVNLQATWLTDAQRLYGADKLFDSEDIPLNTLDVLIEDASSGDFAGRELSSDEASEVLERTHSYRLQELAIEVASLRYEINVDAETSTGAPIFKATTKTEFYASQFGVIVTVDRATFEAYAQRLYEYIYESSADWKRISTFVPDFPRVSDRIKHLRRQAAHDTEHGTAKDIQKKALDIGDHFESLIGRRIPLNRSDWQLAQLRLMEEIALFLRGLSQAVKESC